ncbi:hypothetical protein ABW19_dt0203282 [Dactylella cylindrospora]|nr:hypothetical protein ABW19_dt0203282 [Dactylella cylindrospora]
MAPLMREEIPGDWGIDCDIAINGHRCVEYGTTKYLPATNVCYIASDLRSVYMGLAVRIDIQSRFCQRYYIDILWEDVVIWSGQVLEKHDAPKQNQPWVLYKKALIGDYVFDAVRQGKTVSGEFETIVCRIRRDGAEFDMRTGRSILKRPVIRVDEVTDPFYQFVFRCAPMATLKRLGIVFDEDLEGMNLLELKREIMRLRALTSQPHERDPMDSREDRRDEHQKHLRQPIKRDPNKVAFD